MDCLLLVLFLSLTVSLFLNNQGFEGVISDIIDAPDAIKVVLDTWCNFKSSAYGTNETKNAIEGPSDVLGEWMKVCSAAQITSSTVYTPTMSFTCSRSRYGMRAIFTSTKSIDRCTYLKFKLNNTISELQDELSHLEQTLTKIKDENISYTRALKEKESELKVSICRFVYDYEPVFSKESDYISSFQQERGSYILSLKNAESIEKKHVRDVASKEAAVKRHRENIDTFEVNLNAKFEVRTISFLSSSTAD